MNSFTEAVDYLKKSVLYNLSLSSIELFHSNFLYWLANHYKKEVGSMFLVYLDVEEKNISIASVKRENKNIDLTLKYNNGTVIVIENKVKSIPCREQLEIYSQSGEVTQICTVFIRTI